MPSKGRMAQLKAARHVNDSAKKKKKKFKSKSEAPVKKSRQRRCHQWKKTWEIIIEPFFGTSMILYVYFHTPSCIYPSFCVDNAIATISHNMYCIFYRNHTPRYPSPHIVSPSSHCGVRWWIQLPSVANQRWASTSIFHHYRPQVRQWND